MSAPESTPLAPSWQKRFAFYDAYGLPNSTPAAKAAYKALPFGEKLVLTSNIWAFLFGAIYFYVKGMWQKATTLLGVGVALGVLITLLPVPSVVAQALGFGFAGAVMAGANYQYYLHTRGSVSWNPFEGYVGRRS